MQLPRDPLLFCLLPASASLISHSAAPMYYFHTATDQHHSGLHHDLFNFMSGLDKRPIYGLHDTQIPNVSLLLEPHSCMYNNVRAQLGLCRFALVFCKSCIFKNLSVGLRRKDSMLLFVRKISTLL
ncbi:hypothetical protein BCR34DRAFT_317689 [Clohesyomyces aquaticus]|uniref:Uncharacterized protein n=1 Tax=Clohesyomyces aquaticus TaxID=1231657 RepID=A0A1Y1ZN21_9PLEO|nr:hypothetical protein BCR34DRAFT_317689 [Clohesyomyces aquaticus]